MADAWVRPVSHAHRSERDDEAGEEARGIPEIYLVRGQLKKLKLSDVGAAGTKALVGAGSAGGFAARRGQHVWNKL
jgi:hypothetical protein